MTAIDDLDPEKFLVAGDWHANEYQARAAMKRAESLGIKVVVQVGDFGIWPGREKFLDSFSKSLAKRGMICLFVDGNHEDFNTLEKMPLDSEGWRFVRPGIIHLPRGFGWVWGGLRMGALGGAHSVDQQWRRPGKDWWAQEWINDDEIANFKLLDDLDVVFTHDSPAGAPNPITDDEKSQEEAFKRFGPFAMYRAREHRERVAEAIDYVDPSLVIHGHYHRLIDGNYTRDGGRDCRVIGLDQGGNIDRNTFVFDTVLALPEFGRDFTEMSTTNA